ncbi:MAG: nucleotide exchange factor GrpE [Candidatus Liptonbacteria bacterium]|nr:nucleotide exchange factor GrpE [Candidatus Liptonbacteria bacterium]
MNDDEKQMNPDDGEAGSAAIDPGSTDAGAADAQIQELEKKAAEYLAGWQRAKADYLNYKKDESFRMSEIARYATEDMIREMITVLDSFDLGLAAMEKQGPVEKGVYMIRAQIEDVLRKNGLTRIPTEAGQTFDPSIQEAVAEADSDLPEGAVVDEIEPGYRLHNKVLRAARVRLARKRVASRE